MKRGIVDIAISVLIVCGIAGCHRDNPCAGQSATSANFTIQDNNIFNNGWIPYLTDTVVGGGVTFTALDSGGQYEWHIGSGVYTTQSVTLNFVTAPQGSTIPIMLIIKKTPDIKCFPKDPGIDTVVRNIYINKNLCHVFGSYYGYMTDSPSYKFSIRIIDSIPPPYYTNYAMSNCGSDTIVLTYGWPIIASPVGNYPCGSQYRGLRELIFSVEDTATVASSKEYTTYQFCAAILDSTDNNITINITKYVPLNNGTPGSTVTGPKFIGVRQ